MKRTRRELLEATGSQLGTLGAAVVVAGGSAAIAGCLDFAAGDGPQGPEGTPSTLSCADEEFRRLEAPFDDPVSERSVETPTTTFELSTEATSETYGSTLRLVLRNVGDGEATTLGEHAYAFQRETGEGWLDVRGSPTGDRIELPRETESFAPNEEYSWSLTLREDAFAEAVPDVELDVCPALGPGTHRFVYWGIEEAPPVGVEFELIG